jgi:hypothetical protein
MKFYRVACLTACFVLLALSLLSSQSGWAATLEGLRGGDVWVRVQDVSVPLHITTEPAYGWAESLTLYGPDGTLVQRVTPGRTGASHYDVPFPQQGIYRLQLSRSYVTRLESDVHQMIFRPLRHETSFKLSRPANLYFRVPQGTSSLTLFLDNRRGLQGGEVDLVARPLDNGTASAVPLHKESFTARDVLRELGVDESNAQQALSELSPGDLPALLFPVRREVAAPRAGVWQMEIAAGRTGCWLDGVPDFLAARPDQFFSVDFTTVLDVRLEPGNRLTTVPVLGAVGNFGRHGCYGEVLNQYGVYADKLYLTGQTTAESLAERFSPEHSQHTLLVIRSMPKSVYDLPAAQRPEAFAEWAAEEIRTFVRLTGIDLSRLAVQPFNEPNLEMSLAHYLAYMQKVTEVFGNDPVLRDVRLAGPGLGSGESRELVDWEWIEELLARFGDGISTVVWNCYRVTRPEDAFEIRNALEKTRQIIDAHGGNQTILVGAINRRGGIAPEYFFTGPESGLWWGSVLVEGILSEQLQGMYHYKIIDSAGRPKGLFRLDQTPKPQAYVQQAVSQVLHCRAVRGLKSEKALVTGIAGGREEGSLLFVVNRSRHPVRLDLSAFGNVVEVRDVLRQQTLSSGVPLPPRTCVIIRCR